MSNDAEELECLRRNVAASPAYGQGTLAYYDAFRHIVPCRVLEVLEPGNGVFVNEGKLRVIVTDTVGPYAKGERMTVKAYHVYPRKHRVVRGYQTRINKWYRWEQRPGKKSKEVKND